MLYGDLVERYREFAAHAREQSPCFEAWALGVAGDPVVQAWLADLPEVKQQPNLVFAAARWHGVRAPSPYAELRDFLLAHEAPVKATVRERATQTNEVGRLATLVPAMALVPEPLVLVEAGASAGLCLFPDRYDYAWVGRGSLTGSGGPLLGCTVAGPMPVPVRHPRIVQRIGLDLNPLDVYDVDQMAWLENLVWPEEDGRRARLRAAVEVARAEPPDLRRGDLLQQLPALVEEASRWGTPVVFHSAVIAYLEEGARHRFATMMADLVAAGACHWLSNEAPGVVPSVEPPGPGPANRFLLAMDGQPLAWTHSHGHALTWL